MGSPEQRQYFPTGSYEAKRIAHQKHYPARKIETRRKTDLDVLKERHQFIRNDAERALTWEDEIAERWYSKLFREFAVVDLKHYRSGAVALRWRVESEVLEYRGERTCGNLRCDWFDPLEEDDEELLRWRRKQDRKKAKRSPRLDHTAEFVRLEEEELDAEDEGPLVPMELTPYQLNFAYEEEGQAKSALVKVVLCSRCAKKLRKGREAARQQQQSAGGSRKSPISA